MAASRKLPSTDAAQVLYERVRRLAESQSLAGKRLAVAYSGGLDSTVLLHLFSRLRDEIPFSLQAFHVHHGLSAQADAWLHHCEVTCKDMAVPFGYQRIRLDPQAPESLEARARESRYEAYAGLACDWLLQGHHQDDQAETLLYRLARGAGVHGASAIPARRGLAAQVAIWRPLLRESRASLRDYAHIHDLTWVEDESNASLEFDRNWIRHAVLPPLQQRFPHAAAALARAAGHFADAASLLDELAMIDAGVSPGQTPLMRLPLGALADLSLARRHNLLRWFLAAHGVRPDAAKIITLTQMLLTAADDAQPCLRLADRYVRRFREAVWVSGPLAEPTPVVVVPGIDADLPGWRGRLCWRRLDTPSAALPLTSVVVARPRAGGERLRLRTGGPARLVKHLYQEADIPPWLRDAWPLIWSEDCLVAMAGMPLANSLALAGWQPVWIPHDWADCPLRG